MVLVCRPDLACNLGGYCQVVRRGVPGPRMHAHLQKCASAHRSPSQSTSMGMTEWPCPGRYHQSALTCHFLSGRRDLSTVIGLPQTTHGSALVPSSLHCTFLCQCRFHSDCNRVAGSLPRTRVTWLRDIGRSSVTRSGTPSEPRGGPSRTAGVRPVSRGCEVGRPGRSERSGRTWPAHGP